MRNHNTRQSSNIAQPLRDITRVVLLVWFSFQSPSGLSQESLEYRVKAAFIYNFTKFIRWPDEHFPSDTTPIRICVAGDAKSYAPITQAISGKTSQNRPLTTLYLDKANQTPACHILYIAGADSALSPWLNHPLNAVATIGDAADFIEVGGVMGFTNHQGKIRFVISQANATNNHIIISSKLLALAQRVER